MNNMKNIKELNLELIELEDQVLLVEKSVISVGDYITDSLRVWRWNDDCSLLGRKKVISSTKPLEGLPLLVIEDEERVVELFDYIENLSKTLYNPERHRDESIKSLISVACQSVYNKTKETYKFTEEDLKKILEFWGERGRYDKEGFTCSFEKWWEQTGKNSIESLTKKELWVEIENYCGSPYTTERCPKCVDSCDRAYQRPKITDGKIKAISERGWETKDDFKAGFQKTQELLSDRRFTLEEVELIFGLGAANHANGKPSFEEVIQSLSQPKSWKVECIEENGKIKILRIL